MFKQLKKILLEEGISNYIHRKRKGKKLVGRKTENLLFNGKNIKIIIDENNGYIDRYIFEHGIFDQLVLDEIFQHIKPDSVFLDIGANIGQQSLVISNFCKKVCSFEPLPHLFEQFSESVKINNYKNIQVHNTALGNSSGEIEIFIPRINMGGSTLVHKGLNTDLEIVSQKVQIKKLDEISEISKIDIIKMDVEGFEFEVLKGGKNKILQNKPVIILEYSYDHMEKLKPGTSKELYDFIVHELHYEIKDLKTKADIISFEQIEKIPQTDLVVTPA